ncbi:MAG: DUF6519 domain-containing protein [Pseudomonadota bacterium]
MKGDFSRNSFDAAKHFSRVLMQQGRVTLDADHNEQSDIVLHMLRTLARDLFGQHGGPADGRGFGLYIVDAEGQHRLMIGGGHYYVDGILVEIDTECDYAHQPDYLLPSDTSGAVKDTMAQWLQNPSSHQDFWVYLDVWERHVTWIEDDKIREVALGGPDTCTRTKVVWQVKAMTTEAVLAILKRKGAAKAIPSSIEIQQLCTVLSDALDPISNAQMAARLDPEVQINDPCAISPNTKYRGTENQLYRIEIHHDGTGREATFKWSRDNGSVVAPWLDTDGDNLIVGSARSFEAPCWIEISDDSFDLNTKPGILVKVISVAGDRLSIDPATKPTIWPIARNANLHPKVRRWDQRDGDLTTLVDGAVTIRESADTTPDWISLEDSIQIRFSLGGIYRTGDYWLLPARVATGDIEWSLKIGQDGKPEIDQYNHLIPESRPPCGIEHHYASLGIIKGQDVSPSKSTILSCRNCCDSLGTKLCSPIYELAQTVRPQIPDRAPSVIVKPKNTVASSTPPAKAKPKPNPKSKPR